MENTINFLMLLIGASAMVLPEKKILKIILIPIGFLIFCIGFILAIGIQYIPVILSMIGLHKYI